MTTAGKTRFTAISLFSGAMGLDVGLEQTRRFDLRACVELEPSFCESIRANVAAGNLPSKLHLFEGDIRDIDPAEVLAAAGLKPGQLDILIGGPPCQSFSTAGRRGTVQDPRGTLLWEFIRFVEYMKPKFFLMENVRGLLSAALKHRPLAARPDKGGKRLRPNEAPGSVVRLFASDLQELAGGYHMDCFEVNAVNYGAPQLRERAIFIGNRYGLQVDFPNPTHGPPENRFANTTPSLFEDAPKLKPWGTLRDAIEKLRDPDPVIMDFSPRKKSYLELVPEGSNWRSLPPAVQKESMGKAWVAKGGRSGWWRRLTFDLPCPTLVTMPNHASTSLCHPTEVRALSLREYAAVQEFPKNWVFKGTTSQQYAQAGNAVPIRLGRIAGDIIATALDELRDSKWRKRAAPQAYRIVYVQSHVRTRQWFKRGTTFVWEDGEDNSRAAYDKPQTLRREKLIA